MFLKTKKFLITTILAALCVPLHVSHACTVWGAVKPHEILVAKNRDFYPGNQIFMTVKNKGKYPFFGLYANDEKNSHYFIRHGINNNGLTVLLTFASSIPSKMRTAKNTFDQVIETILGNYPDVQTVRQNTPFLFKDSTPANYLFADRHEAMLCEVGLDSDYRCQTYLKDPSGKTVTFAQTNHYILPGLEHYNLVPVTKQQSSYFRINKINQLMRDHLSTLSFKQFIDFSFNTEAANDDPPAEFDVGHLNTYQDNSIFRTFNSQPDRKDKDYPHSARSVGNMIIEIPADKYQSIRLYLRKLDKITDLNNKAVTQRIQYSEATVTLTDAIRHPNAIQYIQKSCIRKASSVRCEA